MLSSKYFLYRAFKFHRKKNTEAIFNVCEKIGQTANISLKILIFLDVRGLHGNDSNLTFDCVC